MITIGRNLIFVNFLIMEDSKMTNSAQTSAMRRINELLDDGDSPCGSCKP